MPLNSVNANYTLRIEGYIGSSNDTRSQLWHEEQPLLFYQKQVSVFVQTDKPMYRQGETVKFRVICVEPNLLPKASVIDVFLRDPNNIQIRRWKAQQTILGVVEQQFDINDRPKFGTWSLEVDALGFLTRKTFDIEEFWLPRFSVNVSMPPFISSDGYALVGTLMANHSAGIAVRGSANLTLCVRDNPDVYNPQSIGLPPDPDCGGYPSYGKMHREIMLFTGTRDFIFPMEEVRNKTQIRGRTWIDKQIVVNCSVFDWFYKEVRHGWSIANVFENRIDLKFLGDKVRTFKPGLTFTVYVAAMSPFGSPIPREYQQNVTFEMMVQGQNVIRASDRIRQLNEESITFFEIVPAEGTVSITLRAWYGNYQANYIELRAFRYYTRQDRQKFITITSSTMYPRVDQYMVFTVQTTEPVDEVHYQIISNGNIAVTDSMQMAATQKTFAVALSRDMAASSHILVYYFDTNGEVIVDGMNFFVNGTGENDVNLKFNRGKDFSQHSVEVIAASEPGTLVAFQAVDYEIFLRGGGGSLLIESDILDELATYDEHANSSFRHTWIYANRLRKTFYFSSPTYAHDANSTFLYAGLLVFSDANVTSVEHNCNVSLGQYPCYDGSPSTCYPASARCNGHKDCQNWRDEMGCESQQQYNHTQWMSLFSRHDLHYVPYDWMWSKSFIKSYGQTEFKVDIPMLPRVWLINAFSISPLNGLGIPTVPALFSGIRPFYIVVETPEIITLGEQIGVRIAIFNYWHYYLESVVVLHKSDDYKFVRVGGFGSVSSYSPELGTGDMHTLLWLYPGQSTYIFMPCIPRRIGHVDIAVSVYSFYAQYSVTKTVIVNPNSVADFYHTPYLVDLTDMGGQNAPDFQIPVPQNFLLPDRREHLYVPGSQKAIISFVGDVFGAAINHYALDAEHALHMPYGAGENNMFNYAINIYAMKYLKIVNQLSIPLRRRTFEFLYKTLQRQMAYMSVNGSFSMFQDEHKPSTWLTSFVLQTLLDAVEERDWQDEFFISGSLINKVANWLCRQQNKTVGAFIEHGHLFDKKMWANYTEIRNDDRAQLDNVSLTAYVLISMQKHQFLSGPARSCAEESKKLATSYLEQKLDNITDPFQIALVTYALHTTSSNLRNAAYFKMRDARFSQCGSIKECWYWADELIRPQFQDVRDTRITLYPHDPAPNKGSAVQASAYAMMVYLNNGDFQSAQQIMRWIQTQRNSHFGFGSSQDTIVALQSLAEYAQRDITRVLFNMNLTVESQSQVRWQDHLNLTMDNYALMKFATVPPEAAFLTVRNTLDGIGMGLLQMTTWKNVEYTFLIRQPQVGPLFLLENFNESLSFSGFNSSILTMKPCVRYVGGLVNSPQDPRYHQKLRTGMAVLEVYLPSGYVALNSTLNRMVAEMQEQERYYGRVPRIRRAENYFGKIVYYFDYVSSLKW